MSKQPLYITKIMDELNKNKDEILAEVKKHDGQLIQHERELAAHDKRMALLEQTGNGNKDSFVEVKKDFVEVKVDIKELRSVMNRGFGAVSALIFVAGLIIGLVKLFQNP